MNKPQFINYKYRKYCSRCEKKWMINQLRCPDCNTMLRTTALSSKHKIKVYIE